MQLYFNFTKVIIDVIPDPVPGPGADTAPGSSSRGLMIHCHFIVRYLFQQFGPTGEIPFLFFIMLCRLRNNSYLLIQIFNAGGGAQTGRDY